MHVPVDQPSLLSYFRPASDPAADAGLPEDFPRDQWVRKASLSIAGYAASFQ